jgi:hypothetical protein
MRMGKAGGVAGLVGAAWMAGGCMFGSDHSKPPEPYVVLNDIYSFAQQSDYAPSQEDSGLSIIWRSSLPNRIYYADTDSAGRTRGEKVQPYPDSISLESPRVSAYPFPGQAMAWIEWDRNAVEWRIAVLLQPRHYFDEYPIYPPLGRMHMISAASILALADTGFVLGAEGFDSSGSQALWIQRYDAQERPVGEPWFQPTRSALGAPELARREGGGWTAAWSWYQGDKPEIAWQRFDSSGGTDGLLRSKAPPRMSGTQILRLQSLRGGRLLVEARTDLNVPFIIGADGEAESGSPFTDDWNVVAMAADTSHARIYGVERNNLVRMDTAFRIQAEHPLPDMLSGTPETVLLPSGKIALIAHGNGTLPQGEQNSLVAAIVDPF